MVLLKSGVRDQYPQGHKGSGVSRNRPSGLLTWLKPCFYLFILFTIHCPLFTSPAFAEEKVYRINIEGMHCNMCVYRVTKSLKKLKQVKDVEVDLDSGTATVTLYDGEDLATADLEEAVEDSGYKPNGVEVVGANGHSPDKEGEVRK